MHTHKAILDTFDVHSIPELDIVVLGALELFETMPLSKLSFSQTDKMLVLGSGNAYLTAKIVFSDADAVFADESSYQKVLESDIGIDKAAVFSASGSKHSISMITDLLQKGYEVHLITNTKKSPAAELLKEEFVHIFPKNREPYTYNTSTYLSIIFGKTNENPSSILSFIQKEVEPRLLRNFDDYNAYTLLIPPCLQHARDMFRTKFDELFGPMVTGRVFTTEEVKHAKTIIPSGSELFISFGVENKQYGIPKNRLHIPLSENADYAAIIAIGYFVIGRIQKAHPPYFKNNIADYVQKASKIFNQELQVIVE